MKAKEKEKGRRKRHRITRRRALGALATGAGALLAARAARGQTLLEGSTLEGDGLLLDEEPGQWVSWDDGWAYPVTGVTELDYWWIVQFDDGEFAVDPAGWVFDMGIWYPVVGTDADGVWYSGGDGYDYLLQHDLEYVPALQSA